MKLAEDLMTGLLDKIGHVDRSVKRRRKVIFQLARLGTKHDITTSYRMPHSKVRSMFVDIMNFLSTVNEDVLQEVVSDEFFTLFVQLKAFEPEEDVDEHFAVWTQFLEELAKTYKLLNEL